MTMPILISVLAACCAASLSAWLLGLARPDRSAAVVGRLHGLSLEFGDVDLDAAPRSLGERLVGRLGRIGEPLARLGDPRLLQRRLREAGYHGASALPTYLGLRLALPAGAAALGVLLLPAVGAAGVPGLLGLTALAWVAPSFVLRHRAEARRRAIQRALPDLIDSLVICVGAGLGLTQGLLRVAEISRQISRPLGEELHLVNLEVRAGVPRDEALGNFAERTGIAEIRTLTNALVQTERFGTSVAQTLRVQSDVMREKRRAGAEEQAAKTGVKLLFPLALLIFPSVFVIMLGPVVVRLMEAVG